MSCKGHATIISVNFNTHASRPKGRYFKHFDNFMSNLPSEGDAIAKNYGKEYNWYQRPVYMDNKNGQIGHSYGGAIHPCIVYWGAIRSNG